MFHFESVQYSESVHEKLSDVRFEGLKQFQRASTNAEHEIENISGNVFFSKIFKKHSCELQTNYLLCKENFLVVPKEVTLGK